MVIEFAESGNDIDNEVTAKRVEDFGAVEFDGTDLIGDVYDNVGVFLGGHFDGFWKLKVQVDVWFAIR